MAFPAESVQRDSPEPLSACFARVRRTTTELTRTLEPEDTVVQSMPDVSATR